MRKEQEARMRHLCLAAALGGLAIVSFAPSAPAAPAPGAYASGHASLVEPAGYWRRYWRRNGYPPDMAPDAAPDSAVVMESEDGPVLVPLRPTSCGQYRYWDGTRCVDARYHNPYLGPKP
jgi:hypothetical protein